MTTEAFRVTRDGDELATITASAPEAAASAYCRQAHPTQPTVYARRATGDRGKTGYFRCYHHVRGEVDADTSIGELFHVF